MPRLPGEEMTAEPENALNDRRVKEQVNSSPSGRTLTLG
jgi:hypothetical protein